MFGYITADPGQLSPESLARYKGCYCGLCRSLARRHGLTARLTLTYDMTFLVLVLSSLYEPETRTGTARCPAHPLHRRSYWQTKYTDYAADLNLLLAWWSCMDDWEDERRLGRRLLAALLHRRAKRVERQLPRQSRVIREQLAALHRYEDGPEVSADRAADCFGTLMGELFVPQESEYWSPVLRELGCGLGRFIYLMDACIDYNDDEKHGRPNPLRALHSGPRSPAGDRDLLTMMLADAAAAFEHLPLIEDCDLMRNILYAGVWIRFNEAFHLNKEKTEKEKEEEER